MALPSAPDKPGSLIPRIVSAAVMLPVAGVAVWIGDWVFGLVVAFAAGLMYWEWQGLCGRRGAPAKALAALCAAATLLAVWLDPQVALAVGAAGGMVSGLTARVHRPFLIAGFAYIAFACIAMIWLRGLPHAGLGTVLWLLLVVVTTDTAAYFTGRSVGGPKLAPRISPKKTWSGLFGGIAGAAIAGGAVAAGISGASILILAAMGGAFAVIAQLGDLLISKAKRTFDVKDSSNLIPGHGGVLDRFDGFLSASLVLAALSLLASGSPLTWR